MSYNESMGIRLDEQEVRLELAGGGPGCGAIAAWVSAALFEELLMVVTITNLCISYSSVAKVWSHTTRSL